MCRLFVVIKVGPSLYGCIPICTVSVWMDSNPQQLCELQHIPPLVASVLIALDSFWSLEGGLLHLAGNSFFRRRLLWLLHCSAWAGCLVGRYQDRAAAGQEGSSEVVGRSRDLYAKQVFF